MNIRNNRGLSLFGFLVFGTIIFAALYSAFHIIPMYYNYLEVQGQLEAQARKATVFTDKEIRTFLIDEMKKLHVDPADPDQLKINRFEGKIVIDYRYDEVFAFDYKDFYYEIYTFRFNPHAEAPIESLTR